jgi:hypothetical protein
MDTFTSIMVALGFLLFIMVGQWAIETLGEHHYELTGSSAIFDLAHKVLPDLHTYGWISNILPLVLIVFMATRPDGFDMLKTFMVLYLFVMALRVLTAVSTILPKHGSCKVDLKFLNIFAGGGCYDKIFSGHTATVTLLLLLLLKAKHITLTTFWLLMLTNVIAILITRNHYTVDVILGIVISYLVFDGNYDTRLLGF